MKVASIILTLNEEPRIEECLKHIRPHVDYILVLDGGSTDGTIDIATKYADKVLTRPFSGSFAEEKNYARSLIPKDCTWILWLDADERFDAGFLKNIKVHIKVTENADTPAVCFRFARVNLPDGKNYPDYQVRLFRNSHDIEWIGETHEVPYLKTLNIPLDQADYGIRDQRLGVVTVNKYPILHLPRRTDVRRKWW